MITRETTATEAKIPAATLEALKRYVLDGKLDDNQFVEALLCNDLRRTFGVADATNAPAIGACVLFCHWEIPGQCWGSRDAVLRWTRRDRDDAE